MTFRDDHDATLARAEALQRELDAAKEKLEANDEEQAKLRDQIARLRERADKPEPPPMERTASPREMVRAARNSALIGIMFLAVAVGAIGFTLTCAHSMRSKTTATTEPSSCTLTTVPSGAEIYDSRGKYIGTTPITRATRTWELMDEAVRYEARLVGHETATVTLPKHGEVCNTRVRLLP